MASPASIKTRSPTTCQGRGMPAAHARGGCHADRHVVTRAPRRCPGRRSMAQEARQWIWLSRGEDVMLNLAALQEYATGTLVVLDLIGTFVFALSGATA